MVGWGVWGEAVATRGLQIFPRGRSELQAYCTKLRKAPFIPRCPFLSLDLSLFPRHRYGPLAVFQLLRERYGMVRSACDLRELKLAEDADPLDARIFDHQRSAIPRGG